MNDGSLDAALARLVDEHAIIEVTHRYCAALDGRDFEALGGCFTVDAVAVYGGVRGEHRGIDAIKSVCRASLEPLDASQHLVANHLIELAGETATSRCLVRAQHCRRGLPGGENFMVAGTYEDEWRRMPEGWRISRRVLAVTWTEGNPKVLERNRVGGAS
ncbi:MAG: nuclear transport factor 2 family protein [Actinomycetota bacterium]|jgi:ketosteroid isomerase-like protein|nr:nuclear transport factor 2 family protein [Actinomycetota bacterium]